MRYLCRSYSCAMQMDDCRAVAAHLEWKRALHRHREVLAADEARVARHLSEVGYHLEADEARVARHLSEVGVHLEALEATLSE